MAFFKKFLSFFDFSEDLKNEYLILDYQILGGSILAATVPLLARFAVDQSANTYFNATPKLIHDIIDYVRANPFLYFKELKEKSFPVIRAKIEDPNGALHQSWIESYVKDKADSSDVIQKAFKVTNPLNSSESINVVFPNLKVFNNEIAGFQLLAQNKNNLVTLYLSKLDTENSFKNITQDSKQFFNFSDVYISGIKITTPEHGEHLYVTQVFKRVRDSLTDIEKEGISKVKKVLLYVSAGIAVFAIIMGVRILIKKRKLKNKKLQI